MNFSVIFVHGAQQERDNLLVVFSNVGEILGELAQAQASHLADTNIIISETFVQLEIEGMRIV